ncbi:hypothetical protein Hdeb2414_s0014g00423461 [Helianthus debilis subsp. tardiflorus]
MRYGVRLHVIAVYFGESRGRLHLIAYRNNLDYRLRLNVYEMFSGHSSWFVRYQVDLNALPAGAFPDIISRYGVNYEFKVIDVVRGPGVGTFCSVMKYTTPLYTAAGGDHHA